MNRRERGLAVLQARRSGRREGRRASLKFLDRAIGPLTGFAALWRSYRHMLEFARTIVDRVVLGLEGPKSFTRISNGFEKIQAAAAEKKGAILLTAHMGSYEAATGMLGQNLGVPFDIVAYEGEDRQMREAIEDVTARGVTPVGLGGLPTPVGLPVAPRPYEWSRPQADP